MPQYDKQTVDKVCSYQYAECLNMGPCPLHFDLKEGESPVEWGKRIEKAAIQCEHLGVTLTRKGYENRYKLVRA